MLQIAESYSEKKKRKKMKGVALKVKRPKSKVKKASMEQVKRTSLNQWNEKRMKRAIQEYMTEVEAGKTPKLRFLARAWGVPKSTLQRRVKGVIGGFKHASGRKTLLSSDAEQELADMIMLLSQRGFPLRPIDIQRLAFDFAKANGIAGFSEDKKRAGYYWFQGFMKRHRNLSIRKPESVSAARAAGMNISVINKWFREYETLLSN